MNAPALILLSFIVGLHATNGEAGDNSKLAAPTAWSTDNLPPGVMGRMGPLRFANYGRVMDLAFNSDGSKLAAGCWDGTVWVADVSGATPPVLWQAHDAMVRAVAFSPRSESLASAAASGEIRLWDVNNARLLKNFKAGKGMLNISFSPQGTILAVRSVRSLTLWDLAKGNVYFSLDGLKGENGYIRGTAPAFSSDGNTVSVASHDVIQVVDIPARKIKRTSNLPEWWWQVLSPTGSHLARFEMRRGREWKEYTFQIWDIAARRSRLSVSISWNFDCIAFAGDGRSVAVSDGTKITIYELATGTICKQLSSADKGEVCMAISPDGKLLATGSTDQSVLLWDLTGRMKNGKWVTVKMNQSRFATLWNDLATPKTEQWHNSLWELVAGGQGSVAFLRERLEPVAIVGVPRQVQQWIADLDSEKFAVRQVAAKALKKIGDQVKVPIQRALQGTISLETHRRLDEILNSLADVRDPETARTIRAITVLERIGSPEAQAVLTALADGAPGARETDEAKASLQRLSQRASIAP